MKSVKKKEAEELSASVKNQMWLDGGRSTGTE
jgi:hypothetical protein